MEEKALSRELREKADRVMRELKDALVPLSEEIKRFRFVDSQKNDKNSL